MTQQQSFGREQFVGVEEVKEGEIKGMIAVDQNALEFFAGCEQATAERV